MMVDKIIFARSFSRQEQKKLACGAFMGYLVIAVTFSTVFKQFLCTLPIYQLNITKTMKPIVYNFSNSRSDVYDINGDVRIHGMSSTIFIASSQEYMGNLMSFNWTTKPYARKKDTFAMGKVTNLKIKYDTINTIPHCNKTFTSPAIVFSTGGYAGNHFHAFTDVLVPLFSTSHQFNREIVFLVTDKYSDQWTSKYQAILHKLSRHSVYEIDKENQVLCFSRMIVGLKADKEFITIDDDDDGSMRNFKKMVRSSYMLARESLRDDRIMQPRMLIVCRKKTRHLVNKLEIADMARSLGLKVVLKHMAWNVSLVSRLVNSIDVMVGVHGAGLTNMVFLPENAVVVQIVPFGLEFIAKGCFKHPAESMNLRYLEYTANLNESLFSYKNSAVVHNLEDPNAISKKGFEGFRSVYLDSQDINIDLVRFRKTLLRALELLPT